MISSKWLGLLDYSECLSLQMNQWVSVKESTEEEVIFGVEHPSVITLGVRGNIQEDLFLSKNIPVVKADRGGQATLHSPGQLVIYPVLSLRKHHWGVRDFIEILLLTSKNTFSDYGLSTQIDMTGATGLYTDKGKIGFCGLRIKEGISYHGLSLNLKNDLGLFGQIRPCGILLASMDRLQDHENLTRDIFLEDFFQRWNKHFQQIIGSA